MDRVDEDLLVLELVGKRLDDLALYIILYLYTFSSAIAIYLFISMLSLPPPTYFYFLLLLDDDLLTPPRRARTSARTRVNPRALVLGLTRWPPRPFGIKIDRFFFFLIEEATPTEVDFYVVFSVHIMAGFQLITFGMHKGETFEDVRQKHKSYVKFCTKQPNQTGDFAKFVAYCSHKEEAAHRFVCPVHHCAMDGPLTSKNGLVINRGGQFYACHYQGTFPQNVQLRQGDGVEDCNHAGFIWADGSIDGSAPFSDASCRRFDYGDMLASTGWVPGDFLEPLTEEERSAAGSSQQSYCPSSPPRKKARPDPADPATDPNRKRHKTIETIDLVSDCESEGAPRKRKTAKQRGLVGLVD